MAMFHFLSLLLVRHMHFVAAIFCIDEIPETRAIVLGSSLYSEIALKGKT